MKDLSPYDKYDILRPTLDINIHSRASLSDFNGKKLLCGLRSNNLSHR